MKNYLSFEDLHAVLDEGVQGIAFHHLNGCVGSMQEQEECNTQTCAQPVDCHWSEWSKWTGCSAACLGTQTRNRDIDQVPKSGGKPCAEAGATEVRACNEKADACSGEDVHKRYCRWAQWEIWGTCSTTCGTGTRRRNRHLERSANPDPEGLEYHPDYPVNSTHGVQLYAHGYNSDFTEDELT